MYTVAVVLGIVFTLSAPTNATDQRRDETDVDVTGSELPPAGMTVGMEFTTPFPTFTENSRSRQDTIKGYTSLNKNKQLHDLDKSRLKGFLKLDQLVDADKEKQSSVNNLKKRNLKLSSGGNGVQTQTNIHSSNTLEIKHWHQSNPNTKQTHVIPKITNDLDLQQPKRSKNYLFYLKNLTEHSLNKRWTKTNEQLSSLSLQDPHLKRNSKLNTNEPTVDFRRIPLNGHTRKEQRRWASQCKTKCGFTHTMSSTKISDNQTKPLGIPAYDELCFDTITECPWCNCLNKHHCTVQRGDCLNSTCAYGWQNSHCRTSVCPKPFYAPYQKCSLPCHKPCLPSEVCHPITGECYPIKSSHSNDICPRKHSEKSCSHRCHCWADRLCCPETRQCPENVCKDYYAGKACTIFFESIWHRPMCKYFGIFMAIIALIKVTYFAVKSSRRRNVEL